MVSYFGLAQLKYLHFIEYLVLLALFNFYFHCSCELSYTFGPSLIEAHLLIEVGLYLFLLLAALDYSVPDFLAVSSVLSFSSRGEKGIHEGRLVEHHG